MRTRRTISVSAYVGPSTRVEALISAPAVDVHADLVEAGRARGAGLLGGLDDRVAHLVIRGRGRRRRVGSRPEEEEEAHDAKGHCHRV